MTYPSSTSPLPQDVQNSSVSSSILAHIIGVIVVSFKNVAGNWKRKMEKDISEQIID